MQNCVLVLILKKSSLCSELAKFADVVWNARNGKKTVVAAVFRSDPIGDEAIAAEETQLWRRLWRPAPFTTRRRMVARAGAAVGPRGVKLAARGRRTDSTSVPD